MNTMFNPICPLVFFISLFQHDTTKNHLPVKGYTLVWNDEFGGTTLNTKKWNYRGLGKRDDAYITEQSVKLDGKGHLMIEVYHIADSVFTGMISTEHIFESKYGYFECRARFTHTPGTFPAFWLQSPKINALNSTPEKDGAELDIFEYYPHANREYVSHAMHWGGYGATHKVEGPVWGKLDFTADDFHTIGFEWTENSYTIFVDGKKTYTGNQLISHVPEFIILSLGVNQLAAGPLDKKNLPDSFMVDYVRVYKKIQ
jgi:beta-glucanase (GH16 family)